MTERYTEADFGLTALTAQFHQGWAWNGTTVDDLVCGVADSYDGAGARSLLDDVLRLLESPLSDSAVTGVWNAASGGEYRIDRLGIDGRDWMRRMAENCVRRIRRDDPAFAVSIPTPAPGELAEPVLDELRLVGSALAAATASKDPQVSGLVPARELIITTAGPDLGFRLLLRILAKYWVPIDRPQYDRMLALGEALDYGEDLVNDVHFLVDLDAE
jgi:hypothetical protein